MNFAFLLVAIVFTFSLGIIAASLFYFIIKIVCKSKVSPQKLSVMIFSFSFILIAFALGICFFSLEQVKDFVISLCLKDYILLGISFSLGCLCFICTKIFSLIFVSIILVLTIFMYSYLESNFPRRDFFEVQINDSSLTEVTIDCYELNSCIILPIPRYWYKMNYQGKEEFISKKENLFSLRDFLLPKMHQVTVPLPSSEYYPVVYKISIEKNFLNINASVKRLL